MGHFAYTTYDVDATEVYVLFGQMKVRMSNFSVLFMKARFELATAFALNANSGGSLVGGWPPEKPGTWSSATGMPAILHRTGALEASLASLQGAPNQVLTHRATFGTNVRYAKFHQHGTSEMPARKIVFEPPGFTKKFAADVADYVVNDSFEIPTGAMFRSMLP